MIRSIEDLPLEGRRVFLRLDLNVPLRKGSRPAEISDDTRIRAALPTIKHCIERDARIILASHLGRPKGKAVPELSLEPVASRLAELLDCDVRLTDEPVGDGARKVTADLREGQIALLENLRFAEGEKKNDDKFAEALASYADVYVNDAFGTAHRAHASTAGMVRHFSDRGAGFVMHKEIEALTKLLDKPASPYVAIIGGAKVSDKIDVLDALLSRVQTILIGGAMANTRLRNCRRRQLGARRSDGAGHWSRLYQGLRRRGRQRPNAFLERSNGRLREACFRRRYDGGGRSGRWQ
jgi:phosphoglycerate kinase